LFLEDLMKVLKIAAALFLFSGLAYASPCSLGFSVQPAAPVAGQTISIYYSGPYLGFVQTPSLSIGGNQVTIEQPTVHADPAFAGHVPCGERTIEVGVLPAGNYSLMIHLSSAPQIAGSFVVSQATVAMCGTSSGAATGPDTGRPAVSVNTDHNSLVLHFQNEGFAELTGAGAGVPLVGVPQAHVSGHEINVTQTYLNGVAVVAGSALFCQQEDLDLGPLPAGSYKVIWTYLTEAGPVTVNTSFNNGANPRGRSVRH
jgi:hypothetical protein